MRRKGRARKSAHGAVEAVRTSPTAAPYNLPEQLRSVVICNAAPHEGNFGLAIGQILARAITIAVWLRYRIR
jgi:hypothetical protein